jgi:hypothetical protein
VHCLSITEGALVKWRRDAADAQAVAIGTVFDPRDIVGVKLVRAFLPD